MANIPTVQSLRIIEIASAISLLFSPDSAIGYLEQLGLDSKELKMLFEKLRINAQVVDTVSDTTTGKSPPVHAHNFSVASFNKLPSIHDLAKIPNSNLGRQFKGPGL